ncbi:hypothetical protein, partial [Paenibacillus sp. Y412MC10]|uniref:hypothetical protein n=1 Tax=Geobacillus sp. (strain Y412MC10) TaxID=481743 RepID=UPI001C92D17D
GIVGGSMEEVGRGLEWWVWWRFKRVGGRDLGIFVDEFVEIGGVLVDKGLEGNQLGCGWVGKGLKGGEGGREEWG